MSPLTGVLAEAWDLYRRFAGHFLLISFVIYVVTSILVALLSLGGIAGALIGAVISFAATYVVQASLIKAVQDVRDGRVDLDLAETVRAAGPHILPVIGASILAGIGITIGFILLIVPGLVLLTYWSLIVPFIVIGRSGVFDSFGHSMRTVRGYAWRVFGTYVLVFLILLAFAIVLGFILLLLPLWLRSFLNSILSGTLIAPFLALVATLVYYRLTAAHAGQPYTPTGPPGAAAWRPPHPPAASYGPPPAGSYGPPPAGSYGPPPAGSYGPPPADAGAPGSAPWGPAAPGPARPYPTPGPAEPGPAQPPPTAPPGHGPDAPPPPGTP